MVRVNTVLLRMRTILPREHLDESLISKIFSYNRHICCMVCLSCFDFWGILWGHRLTFRLEVLEKKILTSSSKGVIILVIITENYRSRCAQD